MIGSISGKSLSKSAPCWMLDVCDFSKPFTTLRVRGHFKEPRLVKGRGEGGKEGSHHVSQRGSLTYQRMGGLS